MSVLAELIAKLEKCEGPDLKLDRDIWLAVTPGATYRESWVNHPKGAYLLDEPRVNGKLITNPPRYSESIDAALTLIEGHMFAIAGPWQYSELHHNKNLWGKPIYYAALSDGELYGIDVENLDDFPLHGQGATPAVALVIASLRAREALSALTTEDAT